MPAPVKNTCPNIDRVIKSIAEARAGIDSAIDICEDDEIKDHLKGADDSLYGLDYELEDLRSSNDKLREWGYLLEKTIESLEQLIEEQKEILEQYQ